MPHLRHFLLGAAVAALAGCGHHAPAHTWIKPGATAQDFARDDWACKRDATFMAPQLSNGAITLAAPAQVRALTDECLQAHGWQVQD